MSTKNKFILWSILSIIVMVVPLILGPRILSPESGMAMYVLSFLAVNPCFFAVLGVVISKDIKSMWSLPIISALIFFLGTFILLDTLDTLFYTVIYIPVSAIAMAVAYGTRRKSKV